MILVSSPQFGGHVPPSGHPERLERAEVFDRRDFGANAARKTKLDVFRADTQHAAGTVRCRDGGAAGARDRHAISHRFERQQVHRWRADETCDERVRGIFVEVDRRRPVADVRRVRLEVDEQQVRLAGGERAASDSIHYDLGTLNCWPG